MPTCLSHIDAGTTQTNCASDMDTHLPFVMIQIMALHQTCSLGINYSLAQVANACNCLIALLPAIDKLWHTMTANACHEMLARNHQP